MMLDANKILSGGMNLKEHHSSINFYGHEQQQRGKAAEMMKAEEALEQDDDFFMTVMDGFLGCNEYVHWSNAQAATTVLPIPNYNSITPPPIQHQTADQVLASFQQKPQQPPTPHTYSHICGSIDGSAASADSASNMTLEDFLALAGILRVTCSSSAPAAPPQPVPTPLLGLPGVKYDRVQNGGTSSREGGRRRHLSQLAAPNTLVADGGTACHYRQQVCDCGGEGSGGRTGKKRRAEEAIERRRKRRIKNRESAARSRAKKQAYTAELEIDCRRIRNENDALELQDLQRREILRRARQELAQVMDEKAGINAEKKTRNVRRCNSCS